MTSSISSSTSSSIPFCLRCSIPALALMTFDYSDRAVWLEEFDEFPEDLIGYPLCTDHADRLTPPLGWTLTDRRNVTRLFAPGRAVA